MQALKSKCEQVHEFLLELARLEGLTDAPKHVLVEHHKFNSIDIFRRLTETSHITKTQLSNFLSDNSIQISDLHMEVLMSSLDKDGDGRLSWSEFNDSVIRRDYSSDQNLNLGSNSWRAGVKEIPREIELSLLRILEKEIEASLHLEQLKNDLGSKVAPFDLEEIFELLDKDNRGFLSLSDIWEFLKSHETGISLLTAERCFRRMDLDSDGYLSPRDWIKSFAPKFSNQTLEEASLTGNASFLRTHPRSDSKLFSDVKSGGKIFQYTGRSTADNTQAGTGLKAMLRTQDEGREEGGKSASQRIVKEIFNYYEDDVPIQKEVITTITRGKEPEKGFEGSSNFTLKRDTPPGSHTKPQLKYKLASEEKVEKMDLSQVPKDNYIREEDSFRVNKKMQLEESNHIRIVEPSDTNMESATKSRPKLGPANMTGKKYDWNQEEEATEPLKETPEKNPYLNSSEVKEKKKKEGKGYEYLGRSHSRKCLTSTKKNAYEDRVEQALKGECEYLFRKVNPNNSYSPLEDPHAGVGWTSKADSNRRLANPYGRLEKCLMSIVEEIRLIEKSRMKLSLRFDLHLDELFSLADVHQNNSLSLEDIRGFLSDLRVPNSHNDALLILSLCDADKDRYLCSEEFKSLFLPFSMDFRRALESRSRRKVFSLSQYSEDTKKALKDTLATVVNSERNIRSFKQDIDGRLHSLFELLDILGSGRLTLRAFEKLFRDISFEVSNLEISALMERMDRDKDGEVTFGEFVSEMNDTTSRYSEDFYRSSPVDYIGYRHREDHCNSVPGLVEDEQLVVAKHSEEQEVYRRYQSRYSRLRHLWY